MFWDEEIYCHDDGRSSSGFWSNPQTVPKMVYRAYFNGEVIGDFATEHGAEHAVEEVYAKAQAEKAEVRS